MIIDFVGRDTCKVVSTFDGKVYIRNVKFLTRAPMLGQALIFDDIDDRENSPKLNIRGTDDSAKRLGNLEQDQDVYQSLRDLRTLYIIDL